MGRPRKWGSDAERMAAVRAAQNGVVTDEPEMVMPELPAGRAAPPIEEYVAEQLGLTRRDVTVRARNRTEGEGLLVIDLEARLAKTEKYARWRHKGYVAGEIVSL